MASQIDVALAVEGDPLAFITYIPAQVGRVETPPRRIESSDEGVLDSGEGGLRGLHHGEVGRGGVSGDEGFAATVDRDRPPLVVSATAEVGGVHQRRARGGEFGDECIPSAAGLILRGARRCREVRGRGPADDPGAAGPVDSDVRALIEIAAPEIGGVNKAGAGRIELGHERLFVAIDENRGEGIGGGEVG